MLSVIIPTLKRPLSLVKLVKSLSTQKVAGLSCEILVIYNDIHELEHSPLIAEISHNSNSNATLILKLFSAPSPGVNNARNHGVEQAKGSVLLFVDDDCLAEDPFFLQKHWSTHQEHPNVMAVGGPYVLAKESGFWDRAYQENIDSWLKAHRTQTNRSPVLLGGNASYKKNVFDLDYRFPPQISYGGSETGLNQKLLQDFGDHYFSEDLAITHHSQINFSEFCQKAVLQGRGLALQETSFSFSINSTHLQTTKNGFVLQRALDFYSLIYMASYHQTRNNQKFFAPSLLLEIIKRLLLWNFLRSLFETPLDFEQKTHWEKFEFRISTFCRKWAWLVLRTLGRR